MKKQALFLTVVLILFAHLAIAQTYVEPGDGTLKQAIADAQDGDVLLLASDGLYTESTNYSFATLTDKSITIDVAGDNPQKARLQILKAPDSTSYTLFFRVGNNASLTLRDLEIDGSLNTLSSAEYLIEFYMGDFPAPTNVGNIRIENCYIRNLTSDVIAAGFSDMQGNVVVDSTFINNCIIENTATSVYYKYAGSNYIEVTNSTFNTILSYGFRIAGPGYTLLPDNTPTVIIDHTTWYNVGTQDGREIILGEKGPNLNPWTVTNSILVKQINKDKTVINIKETTGDSLATITNICLWDIGNINWRNHTVQDTITMDPQFTDPDNGDFTLPAGSPLLTFGSDGDQIGDPRWGPYAFTRITTGVIVNDVGGSFGCGWGDYNNDGFLDLFVANSQDQNNFLYSNDRNGEFTKITEGNIVNDDGFSVTCSWGDYDNDGDLDLFVANRENENNFLYANNGDGTFTKITTGAIVTDGGYSQGCSWGDYDNDGYLDLFVANGGNQNNFLYKNNGDGTFSKITAGIIVNDGGNNEGCGWVDYDNDGDLDLFVANYDQDFLYDNNNDGTFTKVVTSVIVTDVPGSKGCSWGDYDNDGDLDLYTLGKNCLFSNNGDGTFTKITSGVIINDSGPSKSSSWCDYDNDGDIDLFVTNVDDENNFLYSNNGDGTFTKITTGVVVTDGGYSQGCAWGDYDKDGDLDLFVANTQSAIQSNFLYSNNGNSNSWININLIGTISNKSAIGAKVKIKAIINENPLWQMQEISGQSGFRSFNSLNAEFGLGDATVIDSIKVEWPSGIVQVLTSINVNQFLTITESTESYEITGNIGYYSNDVPVDGALVKENSLFIDTTDVNGDYEFLDLPPDNYIVRPEKENDTGNSISAYDAAWILQYGVGLRTFTPYQLIAGDVTGNGDVSAYDAAKVLQYGVGLINQFPVMADSTHFWRFVPEDFTITPSNWTTAPDSIAYTPLNSDTTGNYYGIIYGDVSGNWHPSGATLASLGKSSGETVDIRLEDILGEAGEKVILPVVVENGSDILAMSFTLKYDARVLKTLSILTTELTESWQMAYNIKQGQIKVALAGSKPITSSGAVVNLEFEVLGIELDESSCSLNMSQITINEGNIAVNIQSAKFITGTSVPKAYALSQNYPNPFNAQTVIKYQIPKPGRVVLKIYNSLGQEVRTLVDEEKKAGYYRIYWDGKNNEGIKLSSGIYLYQIKSVDFVKVKKMLLIM